jgi:hypothetical protein
MSFFRESDLKAKQVLEGIMFRAVEAYKFIHSFSYICQFQTDK